MFGGAGPSFSNAPAGVPKIIPGNGLVVKQDSNGDTIIGLDERIRGQLMIGRGVATAIAFDFENYAIGLSDIGGSVLLRVFNSAGFHVVPIDLKTAASIIEFLQSVLARDAEKMMADKKDSP